MPIDRVGARERAFRAVQSMTNWQNSSYMREVAGNRDIHQIMEIAERWAQTPRRNVSRETMGQLDRARQKLTNWQRAMRIDR